MLTIQPKFTQSVSNSVVTFRGDDDSLNEARYSKKRSYYQRQKEEFEEILNDQYVPEGMKKGAKVFKIASEGILEGWAVTWAATKGGKYLKSAFVKLANSKLAKGLKDILKPLNKGLKEVGKNFTKSASKNIDNIKQSSFITNMAKNLTKLEENLNKTGAGRAVVKTVKAIGKGLKATGRLIKKFAQKIAQPFKKMTYDKAAKATASTLGVGSGIAGAYSAARESKNDKVDDSIYDDDYATEVERFEQEIAEDED